jgi:hypothetical protein
MMKMTPGKILAFVLAALSLVCVIMIYMAKGGKAEKSAVGYGMIMVYISLGLAVLTSLLLAARGLYNNPKGGVKTLISLGVLAVFFVIGYVMDDKEVTETYSSFGITEGSTSGLIGGGLTATWIVLGLTFILAVGASIRDFIKRI